MAYEQYPRGNSLQGDIYATDDNFTRDYGRGRDDIYSSAREYEAAGTIGPRADRHRGSYPRGYYSQGRAGEYVARGQSEPYRGGYMSDHPRNR